MAKTYFGSGLMTAIYLGSTEITKVYLGTGLVYSSAPPTPVTPQIYYDFYVDIQTMQKTNNVYTDFNIDLQTITKV